MASCLIASWSKGSEYTEERSKHRGERICQQTRPRLQASKGKRALSASRRTASKLLTVRVQEKKVERRSRRGKEKHEPKCKDKGVRHTRFKKKAIITHYLQGQHSKLCNPRCTISDYQNHQDRSRHDQIPSCIQSFELLERDSFQPVDCLLTKTLV